MQSSRTTKVLGVTEYERIKTKEKIRSEYNITVMKQSVDND